MYLAILLSKRSTYHRCVVDDARIRSTAIDAWKSAMHGHCEVSDEDYEIAVYKETAQGNMALEGYFLVSRYAAVDEEERR